MSPEYRENAIRTPTECCENAKRMSSEYRENATRTPTAHKPNPRHKTSNQPWAIDTNQWPVHGAAENDIYELGKAYKRSSPSLRFSLMLIWLEQLGLTEDALSRSFEEDHRAVPLSTPSPPGD